MSCLLNIEQLIGELPTVEPRYYGHQGTVKMCSPYPEYVLTSVICIEKALKGLK